MVVINGLVPHCGMGCAGSFGHHGAQQFEVHQEDNQIQEVPGHREVCSQPSQDYAQQSCEVCLISLSIAWAAVPCTTVTSHSSRIVASTQSATVKVFSHDT